MLYSNMGKSKSPYKETFFYCNVVIFIGLVLLYWYLNKDINEGIENMGCCGGIVAGIHYSETDTEPPKYVSRCFKSELDINEDTPTTLYTWNSFPCTGKTTDCCGGVGECVASKKGGYCEKEDDLRFIYQRNNGDIQTDYVIDSDDTAIDIGSPRDMGDYYNERNTDEQFKDIDESYERQRFMSRMSKNKKYMLQAVKSKAANNREGEKINKINEIVSEKKKYKQILYTITLIHLLFLMVIAYVLRFSIIAHIQTFGDILNIQTQTFKGNTL
jgi:hypothetical protein